MNFDLHSWKCLQRKTQRVVYWATCLFLYLIAPVCLAEDEWSPGSTDDSWKAISKLQSVNATARVRSPFVTQCCTSSELVERLAAISWIARTQSSSHIPDLELRLSDDVPMVRLFAYEALQSFRHPNAIALVLRYEDKIPENASALKGMGFYSTSGRTAVATPSPYPASIQDRSFKTKQQWLDQSLDFTEWVNEQQEQANENDSAQSKVRLPTSIFSRDELIGVEADAGVSVYIERVRNLRAIGIFQPAQTPVADELRQEKSELNIRYFSPRSAREPILPGIYAVQILQRLPQSSGMGGGLGAGSFTQGDAGDAFPFFVRINRSNEDEQEVDNLLKEIKSPERIERLGQLRSRNAVVRLIDHYRGATDCDRVKIGEALARIGDGRAAEVLFEKPEPHCRDVDQGFEPAPPKNISEWISELDDEAQIACIDQVAEATSLSPSLSEAERQAGARKLKAALNCLHRPLIPKYAQLIEKLFQNRIGQIAKQELGKERSFQEYLLAEAMVAASNDDPDSIKELLKRIEELDLPELYFRVIAELDQRVHALHYSSASRLTIYEHFTKWRGVEQLSQEQAANAASVLNRMARESFDLPLAIAKPVWSTKEFDREYILDDHQQFWSVEHGMATLWGTFCRQLPQLHLVDADTLCVVADSGAIQVVQRGRKVKSWTALQLFAGLDAAKMRMGQRVGSVGDSLVVSTQSTFVFVAPISEKGEPWRVPDPQLLKPLPADAFDDDNPFRVDPEVASKPIQRNKQTPMSGVPNVWKLGSKILIENRGEIDFAIQCVDVKERKVLWEKQKSETNLRKMIEDEGWKPLTR